MKDIEAERRAKIEKSGLKVIQGGLIDAPGATPPKEKEQEKTSDSFRFPDEFFEKPSNANEPGILDDEQEHNLGNTKGRVLDDFGDK